MIVVGQAWRRRLSDDFNPFSFFLGAFLYTLTRIEFVRRSQNADRKVHAEKVCVTRKSLLRHHRQLLV